MTAYADGLPMTGAFLDGHMVTRETQCDCGWDGTTDISMRNRYEGSWHCPTCDTEHQWEDDR